MKRLLIASVRQCIFIVLLPKAEKKPTNQPQKLLIFCNYKGGYVGHKSWLCLTLTYCKFLSGQFWKPCSVFKGLPCQAFRNGLVTSHIELRPAIMEAGRLGQVIAGNCCLVACESFSRRCFSLFRHDVTFLPHIACFWSLPLSGVLLCRHTRKTVFRHVVMHQHDF